MFEVCQVLSFLFGYGVMDVVIWCWIGCGLCGQYEQVILLFNLLKLVLVFWFVGILKCIGWCGEMCYGLFNDICKFDKQCYLLMIECFMVLVFELGVELLKFYLQLCLWIDDGSCQVVFDKFVLSLDCLVLVFCFGVEFGEVKCWLVEYYVVVVEVKICVGWQVWLFGLKNDYFGGEEICQCLILGLCEEFFNFVGEILLVEVIDLMFCVGVVVFNDFGLMYVVVVLDCLLVGVYGFILLQFILLLVDWVEIVCFGFECSLCFECICCFGYYNCFCELLFGLVL